MRLDNSTPSQSPFLIFFFFFPSLPLKHTNILEIQFAGFHFEEEKKRFLHLFITQSFLMDSSGEARVGESLVVFFAE